ncbi:hypothetical protein BELL_1278g00020 [Botrytis elliptica]|uniref:Uncharacterized protein n=1 Tax=Botrytis elliptica TaxID=278938 RepID=A0A4Z1IBB6_9HELO|nr:hypothetical protein BELL_1278g00020 [Botrytis elliptica]
MYQVKEEPGIGFSFYLSSGARERRNLNIRVRTFEDHEESVPVVIEINQISAFTLGAPDEPRRAKGQFYNSICGK